MKELCKSFKFYHVLSKPLVFCAVPGWGAKEAHCRYTNWILSDLIAPPKKNNTNFILYQSTSISAFAIADIKSISLKFFMMIRLWNRVPHVHLNEMNFRFFRSPKSSFFMVLLEWHIAHLMVMSSVFCLKKFNMIIVFLLLLSCFWHFWPFNWQILSVYSVKLCNSWFVPEGLFLCFGRNTQ